MRIAFDAKRLFSNTSGLGNYSRTLVSDLINFFPDDEYHLYTTSFEAKIDVASFRQASNVHIHSRTHLLKAYWRTHGLVSDLQANEVDLYHGLSHEIPIGLHRAGIASVVTIHDIIYKLFPDLFSAFDRTMMDLKFGHSIRNSDVVVAITEHTRQDILKRYINVDPAKVKVIYQSCNSLYFAGPNEQLHRRCLERFNLPSEYLLFVGSLEKRKNITLILKAYALLPLEHRLPLIIVGRGSAHKLELESLASSLGIANNISFLSNVDSTQELREVYRAASLFIYPSIYEGFGIPIIEAMLSQKPVITSNMPALREAGGPSTCYIDPYDAIELARVITKILSDENLRTQMIVEGDAYARATFDPHVLSASWMQLYQETIAKK